MISKQHSCNRHLHGDLKESILGNVRAALLNNSDALTDAYKTSVEILNDLCQEVPHLSATLLTLVRAKVGDELSSEPLPKMLTQIP